MTPPSSQPVTISGKPSPLASAIRTPSAPREELSIVWRRQGSSAASVVAKVSMKHAINRNIAVLSMEGLENSPADEEPIDLRRTKRTGTASNRKPLDLMALQDEHAAAVVAACGRHKQIVAEEMADLHQA